MSEKEDIKSAADFTAGRGVPEPLIVVDLDDPETIKGVEDHQGILLARVCIIHNGRKVFSWLSLSAVGFDFEEKRGVEIELETRTTSSRKSKHIIKTPDGYKLDG